MHSTRFFVTVASLLALGMPRSVVAQAATAWSYTMNIKTDSGNGRPPSSIAIRQVVTDRFLRMETVQVSGMGSALDGAEGTYTLMDSGDSTMTLIMPSQKMASVMAMPPTLGAAVTMQMNRHNDKKSTIEDLGPGEHLLGHATERYHVTTAGSVEITSAGQTCTRSISGTSDLWIAPDVDFHATVTAMRQHLAPGAVEGLLSETGEPGITMPKGAALRSINRTTQTDATGTTHTLTMTMDIVELTHGPVSDALFAIPDGYKTMDMRKLMAKLPAGLMDSLTAAAAEKAPAVNLCGGSR